MRDNEVIKEVNGNRKDLSVSLLETLRGIGNKMTSKYVSVGNHSL